THPTADRDPESLPDARGALAVVAEANANGRAIDDGPRRRHDVDRLIGSVGIHDATAIGRLLHLGDDGVADALVVQPGDLLGREVVARATAADLAANHVVTDAAVAQVGDLLQGQWTANRLLSIGDCLGTPIGGVLVAADGGAGRRADDAAD